MPTQIHKTSATNSASIKGTPKRIPLNKAIIPKELINETIPDFKGLRMTLDFQPEFCCTELRCPWIFLGIPKNVARTPDKIHNEIATNNAILNGKLLRNILASSSISPIAPIKETLTCFNCNSIAKPQKNVNL